MMAVHIGEMTSEVETAPENGPAAPAATAKAGGSWQDLARHRSLRSALMERQRRTCCEGFDD
jgi:hypothetical protein